MNYSLKPKVYIQKNKIPVIYLDSCLIIELSRYEKGKCTDIHIQNIGKLYEVLLSLMRKNRILCPLGNQMCEMGMSQQRKPARDFAYRFTNAKMFEPSAIQNMQFDIGYNAFINNECILYFKAEDIFERLNSESGNLFRIEIATIYPKDKIDKVKQEKEDLKKKLNTAKRTNQQYLDFDSQLKVELKADYNVFKFLMEKYDNSVESLCVHMDTIKKLYQRTGINIFGASIEERVNVESIYSSFLLSLYHHQLPYVWTGSLLFAHVMQRPDNIINSDCLDITWASAYLPFVDYAITDKKFCALLNQSGLVELYGTKVYDFNSMDKLLEELKAL